MKSNSRLSVLVAVVAVAATAAACSNADAGSKSTGGSDASGAFEVSTSSCPPEATQALGDGEPLKVGTVWPLSGPYAALGEPIVAGMKTALASVNADGGIDGHQVELEAEDDGYDPSKTLPVVTKMIQQDKVFATVAQAGTPNVAAVQPLYEQSCTPQLFVGTGAPQYGDPANHPWTISGAMAYNTEADAWADYLKQEKPGAKVAYLAIDTDGGKAYSDGFEAAAKEDGLTVVASEKVAPDAATVENQVTNLLAAKPDVIILMSVGASCAKAMGAMAAGGFKGTTIAAYTCAAAAIFPVLGQAAQGALAVAVNKNVTDASDADIQKFRDDIAKYGEGTEPSDDALSGYRYAMVFVEAAKAAAELDGGLTRANLMDAAWNLDSQWFASVGGAARTDGTKDAYALETGQMVSWDAAKKELVPVGEPIDREGKTAAFSG
ncbi:ABC transporter substrate-binding protein [Nocardioides sp. CGMCC 1.13656]|nr:MULTISPECIES: ABC transporter substrate-binding protein [unclassified Nocardioides]MBA2953209.1 ABC transporter substrate-binding protein [Nocardioides sp. CGMCC 1.13656]